MYRKVICMDLYHQYFQIMVRKYTVINIFYVKVIVISLQYPTIHLKR